MPRYLSKRVMRARRARASKKRLPAKRRPRRRPHITTLLKNKTTASLRFVDLIQLNAPLAGITSTVYRANSIYDPAHAAGGHQPLMFDEYALLYDSYWVISSKITITPVPNSNSNATPCLYGVLLDADDTLTYTQGSQIIEDKRNKSQWAFSGFNSYVGARNQVSRSTTFNARRNLSPIGANNSVPVTQNPPVGEFDAFFHIWQSNIYGNDPGFLHLIVQVDYVVQFSDPKHVSQS